MADIPVWTILAVLVTLGIGACGGYWWNIRKQRLGEASRAARSNSALAPRSTSDHARQLQCIIDQGLTLSQARQELAHLDRVKDWLWNQPDSNRVVASGRLAAGLYEMTFVLATSPTYFIILRHLDGPPSDLTVYMCNMMTGDVRGGLVADRERHLMGSLAGEVAQGSEAHQRLISGGTFFINLVAVLEEMHEHL